MRACVPIGLDKTMEGVYALHLFHNLYSLADLWSSLSPHGMVFVKTLIHGLVR